MSKLEIQSTASASTINEKDRTGIIGATRTDLSYIYLSVNIKDFRVVKKLDTSLIANILNESIVKIHKILQEVLGEDEKLIISGDGQLEENLK